MRLIIVLLIVWVAPKNVTIAILLAVVYCSSIHGFRFEGFKSTVSDDEEEDSDMKKISKDDSKNKDTKESKTHKSSDAKTTKTKSKDMETFKNDFQIQALNLEGHPDLLDYMIRKTRSMRFIEITLKDIVNECVKKGVKELIIFDYSCSNILDNDTGKQKSRITRSVRRNIERENQSIIEYPNFGDSPKKNRSRKSSRSSQK
jgi:uncharacterized protein YxeA